MSVLEDVASTASDTSPASGNLQPRSRLRTRSASIKLEMTDAHEAFETADNQARKRGRSTSEDHGSHQANERSSANSTRRYEFRERRQKPERYTANMYDEAFDDIMYERAARAPENDRTRRRRRSRRESREVKRQRLVVEYNGELSEEDASDIEAINRQIELQERMAPRHDRATRYALRYKSIAESTEDFPASKHSPDDSKSQERRSRRSTRRHPATDGDDADHDTHSEEHDDEHAHRSENEDDELEEAQEEGDDDGHTGRYDLRRRSRTGDNRSDAITRRNERVATRNKSTADERSNNLPAFITGENEPRYSLRDRSKVQRFDSTPPRKDPALQAFADYAKRQSQGNNNSRSSKNRHRQALPPFSSRESGSKRSRSRRSRHRRRSRSWSSDSSSSSSSESLCNYREESDEGGMRSSGRRGNGRKGKSGGGRADITPIEVDRSITWDSVGGLERHIEALKEMVMLPLLYPEFYDKYNVTPPSGVLFYGPPGTGKTLLARALANSYSMHDKNATATSGAPTEPQRQVTFYMRKGADCLSKWVGEAERQLRLLFEEARRNEPSIIFFDEIDGLAPVRSAKQDQIHASIVSTLLALMDGLDSRGRVVVIGATNRLDAIDPALRRPGRFDRELGFKLPNVRERRRMLEIHSKHWKPALSESFAQEIAEKSVGYCGADIKALCAEAALCALRRTYPQVYGSQAKLLIELDKIVVSRGDFTKAMKKITPASHRTVSSFASPLPLTLKFILTPTLDTILKRVAQQYPLFPLDQKAIDMAGHGGTEECDDDDDDEDIYEMNNHDDCDVCHGDEGELMLCDFCPGSFHRSCLPGDHNGIHDVDEGKSKKDLWLCPDCVAIHSTADIAKIQRTKQQKRDAMHMMAMPLHVGFPRVLIGGPAGMGQAYIGAALLHALEGLSHFSIDYPSLLSDPNTHTPEEALIRRLGEAQKCLPCVICLPDAELWWQHASDAMHVSLQMLLMNMQIKSNLPVIFIAWASVPLATLPQGLRDLFRPEKNSAKHAPSAITLNISTAPSDARKDHFAQVFATFATPPIPVQPKKKHEDLPVLPYAPAPKKQNQLTPEERAKIKERDMHFLRELRIFLGQVLDYCVSQKNYSAFHFPVDPEAVPDYYLIVENPMDLSTMREKLSDGDYTSFEQFLDDIQLIVRNANVFNPRRSATRHIAHAAGSMKDTILSFAHRFRKRQGYDLFEKCRDVTKRLHEDPSFYAQSGRMRKSGGHVAQIESREVVPVRTSARLRGIKASEVAEVAASQADGHVIIEEEKASEPANASVIDDSAADTSPLRRSQRAKTSTVSAIKAESELAEQWFGSDSDSANRSSTGAKESPVVEVASQDEREEEAATFKKGDHVFVKARTYPGINKEGGAGVVLQVNVDGSYHVKYIFGGGEKFVEPKYITKLTDDAVKESVKNQRQEQKEAQSAAANGSSAATEVKSVEEMRLDYFDKLVWPILADEGWTRSDAAAGDTDAARVKFFPSVVPSGSDNSSAPVELVGVANTLAFIKRDTPLAIKCFGKRYAEDFLSEVAFRVDEPDNQTTVEENGTQETSTISVSQSAVSHDEGEGNQAPETETENVDAAEENQAPEFIYDEEKMQAVLDSLVEKSAQWTSEQLRDELLLLNRIAFQYRRDYDRTALMQVCHAPISFTSQFPSLSRIFLMSQQVEVHVCRLSS
ncbi:TPA: hypothetical protein N0F65_003679 [Lagenidium giganteum]|uniref:ATPase family AAA domain-containing protein 2 n=1 Tax=Lagenidium giganteum TaxID=4803 RepID=A0AAV2YTI7_9STRA|nr:TPA: hypothetical protein N0F65_003679 [Lagenidium giganteum]